MADTTQASQAEPGARPWSDDRVRDRETIVGGATRVIRSPAFKFFLILFLIVLLLIPQLLVWALVSEREQRAASVKGEIGRIWGPRQVLQGPFVVVPYEERTFTTDEGQRVEVLVNRRAVLTPETLTADVATDVKELQRSIFSVPVYGSEITLKGRFGRLDLDGLAPSIARVRWDDAVLAVGLSGVSGLKNAAVLKRAGATDIAFSPSLGLAGVRQTGIHAALDLNAEAASNAGADGDDPRGPSANGEPALQADGFEFEIGLSLNGSVEFLMAPAARETALNLTSNWPHPSFSGQFLPSERSISDDGFSAAWSVPHLARSVPERWNLRAGGVARIQPFAFGVRLVEVVDFYDQISRSLKYGLGFLTLVFMAVFAMELSTRKSMHPVQYLFTGVALIFFYVLLLSLAEHLGFHVAYPLAAVATGGMLALYCGMALGRFMIGAIMLGVLNAVYGLLYLILQLEDYALLAGALLGFVALTGVMFATLRVDWTRGFDAGPEERARAASPGE